MMNQRYHNTMGVNVGRGKISLANTRSTLLMEFMYTRGGMTQAVIGDVFDINQSNVSRHIRHVRRFLNQSWTRPEDIAKQISKCRTLAELREWIPRLETAIDGTHFEIDIPSDDELEELARSGKLRETYLCDRTTSKQGKVDPNYESTILW